MHRRGAIPSANIFLSKVAKQSKLSSAAPEGASENFPTTSVFGTVSCAPFAGDTAFFLTHFAVPFS
jgi:hypothetical protein